MATIFHCFKCNYIWKDEMKPRECPNYGSLEWHSTAKKISKQEVDDLIKKILFIVGVAVHNSPLTLEEIKNWLNKYCEIIQPDKIETYINQTCHELIEDRNNGK